MPVRYGGKYQFSVTVQAPRLQGVFPRERGRRPGVIIPGLLDFRDRVPDSMGPGAQE
ncbi:MAG: hypothetical protein NTY71_05335 [Methanoregula sp.]|nr:hypothetical protein [Methanoregula sp.]